MKAEVLGLQSATVHKARGPSKCQWREIALNPGPSATTVVQSSSVDCEWAFKIKPDEAAVVSWPALPLAVPAPPGHHDTHRRRRARRPARGWATGHWR